ncbi:MAG: hypothetical protein V1809_01330 [Planctomycetota bacterium]
MTRPISSVGSDMLRANLLAPSQAKPPAAASVERSREMEKADESRERDKKTRMADEVSAGDKRNALPGRFIDVLA